MTLSKGLEGENDQVVGKLRPATRWQLQALGLDSARQWKIVLVQDSALLQVV